MTSKKDIGIVMQNVAVFEELTVYENINYFCGLYIKDNKERKRLVDEAIDFVGLNDFIKFHPKELSWGLLRRLNIACGIAHKPKLLILDEPTVAVDPQSRNKILEGIEELNRQGTTIIYTTHYMEEVEQICTRIVIIDKGSVIASGTKEELKDMVSIGEKISIETTDIDAGQIEKIKGVIDINTVEYKDDHLSIVSDKGKNNIVEVLNLLQSEGIIYKRVYSELPTLNDVFL